jgi:HEAT repeat protein
MNVKDYRKQVEARRGKAGGLESMPRPTTPREQAWSDAIKQLSDPTVAADVRKNAIQILQAGTFLGEKFDPYRPDYIAALRIAAVDPDLDLRHAALDALVNLGDEFARQKLTEGLQGKGEALLAPAAALGLLARDDHGSASVVARELLSTSADIPTRTQAARVLGADPGASGLLEGIMKDKEEFREVRRAGAVALRSLDPERFQNNAVEILQDSTDFQDIKSTVGGALERSGISLESIRSGAPPKDPK